MRQTRDVYLNDLTVHDADESVAAGDGDAIPIFAASDMTADQGVPDGVEAEASGFDAQSIGVAGESPSGSGASIERCPAEVPSHNSRTGEPDTRRGRGRLGRGDRRSSDEQNGRYG
jgi:hypothetical protein